MKTLTLGLLAGGAVSLWSQVPDLSALYATENGLLTRTQLSAQSLTWGGWLGWKSSGATPAGLWAGPVLVGPLTVVKSSPEKLSFLWSAQAGRGSFGFVLGRNGPFSLWLNQTTNTAEAGGQGAWQGAWGGLGVSLRRQVSLSESWVGFRDNLRLGGRWLFKPWELRAVGEAKLSDVLGTDRSAKLEVKRYDRAWSLWLYSEWKESWKAFGEVTWRHGAWKLKTDAEVKLSPVANEGRSEVDSLRFTPQVLWGLGQAFEVRGEARLQWLGAWTTVPSVQPAAGVWWHGGFSPSLEVEGANEKQFWAVYATASSQVQKTSLLVAKAGLTCRTTLPVYELSAEALWVAPPLRVRLTLSRQSEVLGSVPLEVWGPLSQISLTVFWDYQGDTRKP